MNCCKAVFFGWVLVLLQSPLVFAASLVDTISQVKPSVVGVGTYLPTRRPPAKLLGTGFAVGDGGYVLTNHHVVDVDLDSGNRERLVVFIGSGSRPRIESATLVTSDRSNDLSLLRINHSVQPLRLSPRSREPEGTPVAFTGFPIGAVLGLYPVTHRGMISSFTPIAIPSSSSSQLDAQKIKRLRNPTMVYQLDATAYPGNSGSPLFLPESGEVVGILNMVHVKATKEDVLSKPSGISFAIPIVHARKLLDQVDQGRAR